MYRILTGKFRNEESNIEGHYETYQLISYTYSTIASTMALYDVLGLTIEIDKGQYLVLSRQYKLILALGPI